mgnify:CR=1 FL=1
MSKTPQDPKKLAKAYKFMERFWLGMAVLCTGLSAWILSTEGFEGQNLMYVILPIIAVVLWLLRRRVRKSYERMLETRDSGQ